MCRACRTAVVAVVVAVAALVWAEPAGTSAAGAPRPSTAICQPQRDGPLAYPLQHACEARRSFVEV